MTVLPLQHSLILPFVSMSFSLAGPVQFTPTSGKGITIWENALYLPADLVASPTSTLRSTTGENAPNPQEINNPAYTGISFSSPNNANVTYDTLAGSQNNLLENEEEHESTNLYTSDPMNPYSTADIVNTDALYLEKKGGFPQIADVKNPYETISDSQSSAAVYETIPPLSGLQSSST